MGIFSNIQEKKYTSELSRMLSSRKFNRTFLSWGDVKSIGVLFDSTDAKLNNEIVGFIKKYKKEGLDVQCLAMIDKKIETTSFIFDTFSSKNISWASVPNFEELNNFHNKKFDILLNFYPVGNKTLEFISIVSKARMRIGLDGTDIDCSDLLVGNNNTQSFSELISEAKKILSKMAIGA